MVVIGVVVLLGIVLFAYMSVLVDRVVRERTRRSEPWPQGSNLGRLR